MSRFIGRGKLNVGLLDDDNNPVEGDDVVALPEEPAADSVETQLLEVEESAGDVADVEEQVEDAADVAEGLEELRLQLKSGLEEGGVSKREASAIVMAANRMVGSIGGSAIATPGLEHFGSHSQRLEATRVAMESIGDKIKEIWKRILAQLEKAYEWIRKHMLNVFGAGVKLKERAEKLAKAAEANTVAKAKENKIKRGSLAKELATETGAEGIKVESLAAMTDLAKVVSEQWPKIIGEGGEAVAKVFEDAADGKAMPALPADSTGPIFSRALSESELSKTGQDAPAKTKPLATVVMPGGIIGIHFGAAVADDLEAFASRRMVLIKADKDFNKNGAAEEVKTMEKADIKAVAKHVESLGNYLDSYRKSDNKFKSIEDRIKKAAKKVGDMVGKEKEDGAANDDTLRAIQKLALGTPDQMTGFPSKFYTFAVSKAKHFLDYAELSLAQYKD